MAALNTKFDAAYAPPLCGDDAVNYELNQRDLAGIAFRGRTKKLLFRISEAD